MARREYEFETCDADQVDKDFPSCSEYYPCSVCYGSGKVSDGYENFTCKACGATGCGFASVCGCDDEGRTA